jgi:G3E family GTPase
VDPDQIIVETSGVALPSDTQLHFWREPISTWVDDDMALVVVNAEQLMEGRDLQGTFEDQVSSADLLLLNKSDLVPHDKLPRCEAALGDMAPGTPVVCTVHGRVDAAVLFPPDPEGLHARRRSTPWMPRPHHHEAFVADELYVEDGIEPDALLTRLRCLNVLRAKGFVHTARGLRLVQGVGRRLELVDVPVPPPTALLGRVVIISRAQHRE